MKLSKLVFCLTSVLAQVCGAATLVSYNFNDQTNLNATLTASTLGSGIGSASLFAVSDGGFTSTNVTTASPPDTPAVADSGSWDGGTPTKYFSFTFTPSATYTVNVTGISFDYRQTATGALSYQISIGSVLDASSGTFTRNSTWLVVSDSVTITGITTPTEVRIYGFDGGSGSFGIDRVTLSGTAVTAAVPEPSSFAFLGGLAALGFVGFRRSRGARI